MSNIHCAGCNSESANQRCPVCFKLGITSYFCSQTCFKSNWSTHKAMHVTPINKIDALTSLMSQNYTSKFKYTGTLRPYSITSKRSVPSSILMPDYASDPLGESKVEENHMRRDGYKIPIISLNPNKDPNITHMDDIREVCHLSRAVLDKAISVVSVGVTTDEIDRVVHDYCTELDLYPSPLNYYNFPKSCCTSVNEIVCHGIPDTRPLEAGDIINLDISCYSKKGVHGDLNETIFVDRTVDQNSIDLVHCSYNCLLNAMKEVQTGTMYRQFGNTIEHTAKLYNYAVNKTYCGHGIGKMFHCNPTIPHYSKNKAVGQVSEGHVFTIEPMINAGKASDVKWPDDWTSATADGSRSAQFEHTMTLMSSKYNENQIKNNINPSIEILTDFTDGIPHYQKQLSQWGIPIPDYKK